VVRKRLGIREKEHAITLSGFKCRELEKSEGHFAILVTLDFGKRGNSGVPY